MRPALVVPPDAGTAFLTDKGEPISLVALSILLRNYIRKAKTGKQGAVHIFRHSMATHLLDAGADIRAIQEMLGHVKLTTTQLYTQVSINRLKAVHQTCHPAAKLAPSSSTKAALSAAAAASAAELAELFGTDPDDDAETDA